MVATGTKIAAIVQARMGSTRFPGKTMANVYHEYGLLELVLLRVLQAKTLDLVVLATSEEKGCDPLEALATRLGVATVRGSEEDVLSRFVEAIERYHPDTVVRICADNPLVAPEEIDKLVTFFAQDKFDYAANNTFECGLPDGLGCEAVSARVLAGISEEALNLRDREHVTEHILNHPERFRLGWLHSDDSLRFPEARLDIDTPEDLERMRSFCRALPPESAPYWSSAEIVACASKVFGCAQREVEQ